MTFLSNKHLEKYSRQIIIDKIGLDGQKKILESSICIIGCGGLGTSASQYLAMSGIGKLMLVDDDRITLSNLNRQTLFTEKDIGRLKTVVLSERLQKINPVAKIKVTNKKVSSRNISNIISDYDIILDCTDNFKSRYIINKYSVKQKKFLISSALQNFDIQALALAPWKGKIFPCYNCVFPETKNLKTDGCDSLGIIAPVAGLGGVLQATMTIKIIISSSNNIFKELLLFDLLNNNFSKIKISRNTNCNVCN